MKANRLGDKFVTLHYLEKLVSETDFTERLVSSDRKRLALILNKSFNYINE